MNPNELEYRRLRRDTPIPVRLALTEFESDAEYDFTETA